MTDLSAFSLEGRTVLVTGANTGIGQAIAVGAARAGAKIIGAGRSSMDETASMIDGAFVPLRVDLADWRAATRMLDEAWDAYGPIHGLINNAGTIRRADAVDFTEADWDDVVDINLKSTFFLSQAFARHIFATAEPYGKIVNVASMLSFQGGVRVASYTASKSGLLGITRLLANEWASKGLNVNAVAPGYVASNNTEALRADSKRSAAILDRIPAGRWGEPADIAGAVTFLLTHASDYMHGAVIPVDGGWLAR